MKKHWIFFQYVAMNLSSVCGVVILWNIWTSYGMLNNLALAELLVGLFACGIVLFRCTFREQPMGASVLNALAITLTGWIIFRLAILEEKSLIAGLFLFFLFILLTKQFYGKPE